MTSPACEYMLLCVMSLGVEKQQRMDKILLAFAGDLRGQWANRVKCVADLIADGEPLHDALQRVPGTISEASVLAIQVGTASGSLAETLRDEARRLQRLEQHRGASYVGIITQFLVAGLFGLCLMSFMAIFLVPKYKKIFSEFGREQPVITQWTWSWMDLYWSHAIITVPATLLVFWLAFAVAFVLDSRLTRGMRWFPGIRSLPMIGKMHMRLELSRILRWLSIAVRRGRPLPPLLETVQWHQRDVRLIDPLNRAAQVMKQGGDCWDGLCGAGLLNRREVALLQSAQRVGNLPWALDETSLRIERQIDDRCRVVFEFLRPVAIGLAAVAVGTYVVSFFMPLIVLIHAMT
jgi:type II secretory pathway component PulF